MSVFRSIFPSTAAPTGPVEYLIVGLGNPGTQYTMTRHNVGFRAIEAIAEKTGARVDRVKFKSLCGDAVLGGKRVLLMKPQTFMNSSGEAVVEAATFYKIPAERIIVFSDDISLDPGKLRVRGKGSAGGHNGLKNIIYLLGKDTFPRVKIGVGAKPAQWDLVDWVLGQPRGEDADKIAKVIEQMPAVCEVMVQGKIEEAMNRFNSFNA